MRLVWPLAAIAMVVVTAGCGGSSVSDPETARCISPNPTFAPPSTASDHREVAVHFTCEGATLAGTLYLPAKGDGAYPAVVWVHASGETRRLGYGNIVAPLVQKGIAVFSYDKRGVGESEGDCCPGDKGHFNLLAADADGAVLALRSRKDIDGARIGFYGASEAGWVVPLADARLRRPVAFVALASGPAATTGEEQVWSKAAGEEEPGPLTAEKKAEATKKVEEAGPSGFDPAPYIIQMKGPGLWLFGGGDKSIPVERSMAVLDQMKGQGKDFTIVTFPSAGHGLLDVVPTAPKAPSTLVRWIIRTANHNR
jgi:uncharacterized protein